jgi:hypothetical protein
MSMSKASDTFYRIYGSYKSVCLIPLPAGKGASSSEVKQDTDGSFYYEYADDDEGGEFTARETVYPSKAAAWEKVKADLRAGIAERECMLEAVILAWIKDEAVAKAPL